MILYVGLTQALKLTSSHTKDSKKKWTFALGGKGPDFPLKKNGLKTLDLA